MSCASTTRTIMPTGEVGYSISCDGSMVGMNVCFEKAGELCPTGYNIHNQNQSSGWMANGFATGSISTKGILVSCKENGKSPASLPK